MLRRRYVVTFATVPSAHLMGVGFTLDWGTATDRGHRRAVNEDSLLAQPPVFLVADGMGGHRAGDTASAIVVDEFGGPPDAAVVTSDWIVDAFTRADGRIREGWGGGTTVAGVGSVHAGCSSGWRAGVGGRWHGQVQPGVREVLV